MVSMDPEHGLKVLIANLKIHEKDKIVKKTTIS
jgi:hypothetical protein